MTTETGRGGVVDYDYSDGAEAEAMLADYCGGSYRPTRTEVGEGGAISRFEPRRSHRRITLTFECEPDAGR